MIGLLHSLDVSGYFSILVTYSPGLFALYVIFISFFLKLIKNKKWVDKTLKLIHFKSPWDESQFTLQIKFRDGLVEA